MLVMWSKSHVALRKGLSYCKLLPCLDFCPWVFCRWQYSVFNLPRDLSWPPFPELMLVYVLQVYASLSLELAVWWHSDKSCDHKNGDSRNASLMCHVNSHEHMFKGLCDFMVASLSWWLTTLPCLVAIGLVQVEIWSI